MKKIYFLVLALCFFNSTDAQIINFTNTNFKNGLLVASPTVHNAKDLDGNWFKVDANNNGEIEISEALQVSYIDASCTSCNGTPYQITDLSSISYFTNLKELIAYGNLLTSLDVSMLPNLTLLFCQNNRLTSLNIAGLTNLQTVLCSDNDLPTLNLSGLSSLTTLSCASNDLTFLDVNGLTNITFVDCSNNLITTLDLNGLVNLNSLHCYNNRLESLFVKNGKSENTFDFSNNPTIKYICADLNQITAVQSKINTYGYPNCHVNSYCTFVPGGTYYFLNGNVKYDLDSNGCDNNDLSMPYVKFSILSNSVAGAFAADNLGRYYIPVLAGNHTITPVLENPSYFNISPSSINAVFPTQTTPFTQNVCVTANGVHPDLEVTVLPLNAARPGFDAKYKLVYKNKGNTTQSGTVSLGFNDAVLDFIIANPVITNQTVNNLSWNFSNLLPFETREITFTLNVNSPMESPSVNGGDVLTYNATISSAVSDDTPSDNALTLNQTVLNSFDPNDKTCLEGTTIPPSKVGDYVHYMIRFENTGTYPAQNIVVKDMIDTAKFDVNSLIPMKGSHSYVTNISAGNKVEFIFENINLPFDDANNDGFVTFKIKTKPTLVLGNTFSNTASIYFDYNFPIVTNTATTTIAALSNQDFEFSNYFNLYPNPVHDVLNIATKESIAISSVNIYNTLGQLVLVVPNANDVKTIDVSNLTSGNYFIKINSDKGTSNTKFIKN